jgi:16S rRNA (uracil1498-N3)-methyltransferase
VAARGAAPAVKITLAASVIKPERMELVIQKACELGAHEIVPVLSERCVVRLSRERWESKIKRWRKIAVESCKQCGRSLVPEISGLCELKNMGPEMKKYDKVLIPTLAVTGAPLYASLKKHTAKKVLALVGPEGDFSPKEAAWAAAQGAEPVTLGPLVMRSETAAIYILSLLNFYYREIQTEPSKN